MKKVTHFSKKEIQAELNSWFRGGLIAVDCAVLVVLFTRPEKAYLGLAWLIIRGWTK